MRLDEFEHENTYIITRLRKHTVHNLHGVSKLQFYNLHDELENYLQSSLLH